jgi:hypothetical protein
VPFSYYDRLSQRAQAIYRKSDATTSLPLPGAERLRPLVEELRVALIQDDRRAVEQAAGRLTSGLARHLSLPPVTVQVLAVRPAARWGELHGLYTRDDARPARIQLWMRTARHRRVVAFRTFLRTLLHEVGHHVDYELLRLADSFHTEGFFKRESSLFHQLVPEDRAGGARGPGEPGAQDSEEPPGLK